MKIFIFTYIFSCIFIFIFKFTLAGKTLLQNVDIGDEINSNNVRSVRPGNGIAPKYLKDILGNKFVQKISAGTALEWTHFEH
jgi:sialic acid synthase SpsE